MSEEKDLQTPEQQPQEEKKLTPGQQRRRQRSVFQYLAILFAAAFLLLMFTFAMEKRQFEAIQEENQEQIDDLQQSSISAVDSLNRLLKENEHLKEQVAQLEEQLLQEEQEHQSYADGQRQIQDAYIKSIHALDWFWQIDEAYVRGRYALCRELIQALDEAGLAESLPKQSFTDNDRFSPYHRLIEIRDAVS